MTARIHNFTARQPSAPAHTGDDFIRADGRTRLGTYRRPADLRCFTRDKDAGALVEWATPEAYRPDLAEQLRESVLPQRPVVTLGAKLFVGAVWVALVAYCIAVWMGAIL